MGHGRRRSQHHAGDEAQPNPPTSQNPIYFLITFLFGDQRHPFFLVTNYFVAAFPSPKISRNKFIVDKLDALAKCIKVTFDHERGVNIADGFGEPFCLYLDETPSKPFPLCCVRAAMADRVFFQPFGEARATRGQS